MDLSFRLILNDGVFVRNDPVNFIDPWGLAQIVNGGIGPSVEKHQPGWYKNLQKAERKGMEMAFKNVTGLPVPSGPSFLGAAGKGVLGAAIWVLTPKELGDGTAGIWDENGNGIPDLIEPLDNDDC